VSFVGPPAPPPISDRSKRRQLETKYPSTSADLWITAWLYKNNWHPPWGRKVLRKSKQQPKDKMVSTRRRAVEVPTVAPTTEVGDLSPSSEISRILEAQARMQQEFAEYKKRNADEMEALREENSHLRRKIETDRMAKEPCPTHLRVDIPPTKNESEYKLTGPTTGGNYSSFASRKNRQHHFIDGITETPYPISGRCPPSRMTARRT